MAVSEIHFSAGNVLNKMMSGHSLPYRKFVLIMQLASRADALAYVAAARARESPLEAGCRP